VQCLLLQAATFLSVFDRIDTGAFQNSILSKPGVSGSVGALQRLTMY